ncbi:YncE family protein [Cytobacillus sp. Hm23]
MKTHSVITTTPVGNVNSLPNNIAITTDGKLAYVDTLNGIIVTAIDTKTHSIIASIQADNGQNFVAFTPNGKFAYVGNQDETVSVFDVKTHSIIETIFIGGNPVSIAFTPN